MVKIKTAEQIEIMRKAGTITAKALRLGGEMVESGVTTGKIDREIRKFIMSSGAVPSFFGYGGFPGNSCISLNEQVIHGIPSDKVTLREGDLVKIDVGATYKGYVGDCANTFYCGDKAKMPEQAKKLIEVTRQAFFEGIKYATAKNRIGDIGWAIQTYVESNGFSVVRKYIGHGVGTAIHESPDVPNFGKKDSGLRLSEGMTIAIEPMVNTGGYEVSELSDEWTVVTKDGTLSAHYENTIAVYAEGCEILTDADRV